MQSEESSTLEHKSQSVKFSEVRPESNVYLQTISTRSAQYTLVMEEVNGVQWEAALEEKTVEKS